MSNSETKATGAARRASNRARGDARPHKRVRARPVNRGDRVKVTRAAHEGRLFLLPDREDDTLNNFIGYVLGYCLQRFGQKLYAMTVLSNHYHADLLDTDGNLPEFKSTFHGLLARGLNCYRERSDVFWSGDGGCDTRQPTDEETLNDLVYTLANPTKAKLVKNGARWPGFSTYGWKFNEIRRFRKPTWFFDKNNRDMPDVIEVRLSRPAIFTELSDDQLHDTLMERVHAREREIQREVAAKNQRFMGEKKLRKQRWSDAPRSRPDRFTVTPKVVASSAWARLAQLQRDRDWERKYAEARERYLDGEDVVFPIGTYWMRRYIGVKVANAPP